MLTFLALILLYFLPAIIARNKRDATAILIFNLFLGWTGIGWLVALAWACGAESAPQVIPVRLVPVAVQGRFCCRCGSFASNAAHFCTACGHAV